MDDDRPEIAITPREHEVIEQAIEALAENHAAAIYQRAGSLVHVIRDDHGQAQPKIIELPQAHLRTLVSSTVRFVQDRTKRTKAPRPVSDARKPKAPTKTATPDEHTAYAAALEIYQRAQEDHAAAVEAWKSAPSDVSLEKSDAHPPDWAIKGIAARGYWPEGIRPIDGFSEVPYLRPDGSIVAEPGYDSATRTILIPNLKVSAVPTSPGRDDARASADALCELFADFPFDAPDRTTRGTSLGIPSPHRSAALAALLTPFARHAFRGPTPLFLVDANVRGAGKSKLTDMIAEIVLGRPMARTSPATHDEEERKRITSILFAAPPLVLIDNIDRPLGSAPLDILLTAETWSDRVLGKNDQASLPARAIWYGTGNNVQIKSDTARRVCHIRLASPLESPEERTGFRFPDLLGHVRRNRARYVRHALTVLRAWYVVGRPSPAEPLKTWGSYEGWSDIIRNALVWLDEPDPGETRAALELHADTESNALADLLAGWAELCRGCGNVSSMTIGEALAEMESKAASYTRLRDALGELVPTKPGQLPSARSVGMKFHHLRERVQDGRRLVQDGNTRGAAKWRIALAEGSAVAAEVRDYGTTGLTPTHTREDSKNKNYVVPFESAGGRGLKQVPLVPQSRTSAVLPSPAPPPLSTDEAAERIAEETGDDPAAVAAFLRLQALENAPGDE